MSKKVACMSYHCSSITVQCPSPAVVISAILLYCCKCHCSVLLVMLALVPLVVLSQLSISSRHCCITHHLSTALLQVAAAAATTTGAAVAAAAVVAATATAAVAAVITAATATATAIT
eukprot:20913-Heterococcus_DN1.PRE.1